MERDLLTMSAKERARKGVLDEVVRQRRTLSDAALEMRVSYRHAKRLLARYRAEGDAGLVHRSRGRPSSRAKPIEVREAALERCRTDFAGLGPTLAAEKLAEEGLSIDHETLRRWLIAKGQWQRRRKRGQHRSRRERKARFGELLQLDGSDHAWFGEDRERACLMNLVDDATGKTLSLMAEEETTEVAMRALWRWVERYGIPRALYLDRKSVYVAIRQPTREEQLAGIEPRTAFGAACQKLGIALITAYSPQAKGRVERNHGVYQDRFVHELRLKGITDIAGANTLLHNGFIDGLNAKFAKPPRDAKDAHRPLPRRQKLQDVFCIDEVRTVSNDWCIRHENRHYQIAKLNAPLPKPGEKVTVRRWLDGSLHLLYKEHRLVYTELEAPAPNSRKRTAKRRASAKHAKIKPAENHPWRKRAIPVKRP
jgi:transposase